MTTSGLPSWSREVTRRPVSNRTPCSAARTRIASRIAAEPPSATGRPKACAAVVSATPIAEEASVSRGRKACTATPVKSAWASGVRKRRAGSVAGRPA
ncbi:hypothetical protein [Streptomyces sp. NRRL S-813]|uniref:hypothetical protein n=1 Tax=Streptomyces sp. NRRL S-813 TaxID=1463919 RepID=UPI00131B87BC|nr:hypothetical protein [Streptomyces sp. NRRL S-813]